MAVKPVTGIAIDYWSKNGFLKKQDILAVEEPLEIGLQTALEIKPVAVTMRTPGNDDELAAGFLFTEGILKNRNELAAVIKDKCNDNSVVLVTANGFSPVMEKLERNFYTSSSCGVCGKASIDAIKTAPALLDKNDQIKLAAVFFTKLPAKLRLQQEVFESTGGLHASALFEPDGQVVLLREDVGRHNALDKLIGHAFLNEWLPLNNHVLLLSGRASFELVQKAAMAGIRVVAAMGAPSSLAVETAKEFGITLVGFLKESGFNVYCGGGRVEC
ncbi:MAG: formate dehydrogenase accessory sulfurtransferase FdhD [Ferruginibacter sp.]